MYALQLNSEEQQSTYDQLSQLQKSLWFSQQELWIEKSYVGIVEMFML